MAQFSEDLLMGHTHRQVAALAIDETEHFLSHEIPASGFLPQRRRMHGWQQELLTADGVHLLADDVLHFGEHSPTEWQQRVVTGVELADEPATDQQPVAGGFCIGGCVAQGWSDARLTSAWLSPYRKRRQTGLGPSENESIARLSLVALVCHLPKLRSERHLLREAIFASHYLTNRCDRSGLRAGLAGTHSAISAGPSGR